MVRAKVVVALLLCASAAGAAERKASIEKSYPSRPGKIVLVDAGPLDLTVRAADIDDIRIKVELSAAAFKEAQATSWIDAHRPVILNTDDKLQIDAPDPEGFSLLKGVVVTRARMEIVMPGKAVPDLSVSSGSMKVEGEFPAAKPLRLRAASGDIEFTGWAPTVEARSTSGEITIHASRALDDLLSRSASGDFTLTGGARRAQCDNSSGDIRLTGMLGPLGVATTSGSVTVQFDALATTDAVRITTSSGRVKLALPPDSKPSGELSSTRGQIVSSYGGRAEGGSGRFVLEGAGASVTINTTSGRIDLD
jgi:hypothetical protein